MSGRCASTSVSRLAASTQRLSLRLCAGPQRPLVTGRGQLPNSSLRSGHPARAQRTANVTAAPGDARDVTAAIDGDVTICDVISQDVAALKTVEVAALQTSALTEVPHKRGGTSEGTMKKKKTKAKKGRKVKLKPKVPK